MFALQMKSFYRYLCSVTLQRFTFKRLTVDVWYEEFPDLAKADGVVSLLSVAPVVFHFIVTYLQSHSRKS